MKSAAGFALSFLMVLILGCSGVNQDTNNARGGVWASASQGASGQVTKPATSQSDPESNGGSDLAASAPYSGQSTIQQNVNGAPFLTSSQEMSNQQAAAERTQMGLTSRADGTMMSPKDQPASGIGPGVTEEGTPNPSRSVSVAPSRKTGQ